MAITSTFSKGRRMVAIDAYCTLKMFNTREVFVAKIFKLFLYRKLDLVIKAFP